MSDNPLFWFDIVFDTAASIFLIGASITGLVFLLKIMREVREHNRREKE